MSINYCGAPFAPIADAVSQTGEKPAPEPKANRKPRRWRRWILVALMLLVGLVVAARLAMPTFVTWYVNRTIDQNPMYDGTIGDVSIHLWRGSYSIENIRLNKTTGNVPVPFFAAKRVDLELQWDALVNRKLVGRVVMFEPELNFVDAGDDESSAQSGAGGPWMTMIADLFPFKINSAEIRNGSIHFRAFNSEPQVDVFLAQLEASIENLTNIQDETSPLIATVKANALAMDQARFEYQMKFDPFSYRPTFQLATRLIGLDVTKMNELARAYGSFDFERGWFDLVVELDAKEGRLEGYVKPLFRNLKVFSVRRDIAEDNVVGVFWEALVGFASDILKNQPRDQFATVIPLSGDLTGPKSDVVATIGNVLRNAFVRAYLPRLEGVAENIEGLEFGRGSITEPTAVQSSNHP